MEEYHSTDSGNGREHQESDDDVPHVVTQDVGKEDDGFFFVWELAFSRLLRSNRNFYPMDGGSECTVHQDSHLALGSHPGTFVLVVCEYFYESKLFEFHAWDCRASALVSSAYLM